MAWQGPDELCITRILLNNDKLIFGEDELIGLTPYFARQLNNATVGKDKKGDGSGSGILLYAKTADEQPLDQTYYMSGNTIRVKTLHLNQDFSKIRETLDRIAQIVKT